MTKAQINKLAHCGYSVEIVRTDDDGDPAVYRVENVALGIGLEITKGDDAAIANLVDADLHALRVEQTKRVQKGENVAITDKKKIVVLGDA